MKARKGQETIKTIPEGVWEGGIINEKIHEKHTATSKEMATDAQGNGYTDYSNNKSKGK